ncbi:MAG TPA: hypothetical protein PK926_10125 [Spirochaetota bacterium]|nr:hypothetical protein [Spirochaetota bacterium]HPR48774.1 hypothetical protein [Spirochaetota bacterium]
MFRKSFLIVFFIFFPAFFYYNDLTTGLLYSEEQTVDLNNYLKLQKLYEKWHAGLFGGRKFHEYILKEYLKSLIGETFQTDYEYYLVSPVDPDDVRVYCHFEQCRWLYVFGKIRGETLEKIVGKDPALLRSWWRSTRLLSVSGVVKKYRLSRDPLGDTVELYLDNLNLHPIGGE